MNGNDRQPIRLCSATLIYYSAFGILSGGRHCREKTGTIRNHSHILTDKWLGNILSIVMDLEYSTQGCRLKSSYYLGQKMLRIFHFLTLQKCTLKKCIFCKILNIFCPR